MQHAEPGVALRLWGRDPARLEDTAAAVTASGAQARSTLFDLADAAGAARRLLHEDETEKFDIAYLVAGSGETRPEGRLVEEPEQIARLALVNYAAPASMAAAIAERMAQRGSGRIVLIGSAAGHHSLPSAPAYSSSKAGLARFADALRIAVAPHGVSVTLAAPGFIKTTGTRTSAGSRPFEISVDEAARRIVRAGARGKRHYVTPWQFRALRLFDTALPFFLRDALLNKL
jgi:short-subunit dehydrogenase